MRPVTPTLLVLATIGMAAGLLAREPQIDFDRVALKYGDGSVALSHACASGLHPLQSFLETSGALFDPALVSSQRGRYCHIFFRPTLPGFRADAAPDTVASVVFDADSAEAYEWATSVAGAHSVRILPVPATAVAGSDWRGMFVTGRMGAQSLLLHTRTRASAAAQPPDKLPVREAVSALPWDAKDLLFVHDPRDTTRIIVFFGDHLRESWKGVREDEKAYLLRAEFGAGEAHHVRTGSHWLSELLSPGSGGSINIASFVDPPEFVRLQHDLAKLGFQTTHAKAVPPPEHAIPLRLPHP